MSPPPKKPGGLDINLWVDVSPMRPDQFRDQGAMRWTQAARDQQVQREAFADVQQEAQGYAQLASGPAGMVG